VIVVGHRRPGASRAELVVLRVDYIEAVKAGQSGRIEHGSGPLGRVSLGRIRKLRWATGRTRHAAATPVARHGPADWMPASRACQ